MNAERHAHEEKDVDVGSMFWIALILFLSCALIFLCIGGVMRFLSIKKAAGEATPRVAPMAGALPQPRVQGRPALGLGKLRVPEDAEVKTYGWANGDDGV